MTTIEVRQESTGFLFRKVVTIHHFSGISKIVGTYLHHYFEYMKDCKSLGAKLHDSREPLRIVVKNDDKVKFDTHSIELIEIQAKLKCNNGPKSKRRFGKAVGIIIKHATKPIEAMDLNEMMTELDKEIAAAE